MSLLIWLGKGTSGGGLCEVHAWEMSPDVSGIRRRGRGKGWGLGTPWHMEASLASAFPVLLIRWRASPATALFPGVEFGSGTHLQSL